MRIHKLAILVSHPVQYYYRLYQELAAHPRIDLTVYYCWDAGVAGEGSYDREFKLHVKWDLPLLEGYRYRILKNWSPRAASKFWGFINPEIVSELFSRRFDAVFIWGYDYISSWLAFLGAGLSKTPIFLGGSALLYPRRSGILAGAKKIVLKVLFEKVAAFLVECRQNSEYYRFYGSPLEKIFWLPAAVDNGFFHRRAEELLPRKEELKRLHKIPLRSPVVLYVGKLDKNKRVCDILEAWRLICEKTEATLVLVGDGEMKDDLMERIEVNNLKRVIITGFKNQTELPDYYALADIFILTSLRDCSPRVINEAMNFGLPLIVSNTVGTTGDLVQDGWNGFIVPVGNVREISRNMECLLNNGKFRRVMGNRSFDIIKNWSYQTGVESILGALALLKR